MQKYKSFVEGVQLQQLDNDYKLVSDTCDQIGEKLREGKLDIGELKKKVDAAEKKVDFARRHEDMRRPIDRWQTRLSQDTYWFWIQDVAQGTTCRCREF